MTRADLLVVGGGIAGLHAAVEALALGCSPLLLERGPRVGGRVGSRRLPSGILVEEGPHTLVPPSPAFLEELGALGLTADLRIPEPVGRKRHLVLNGRPVALPTTLPGLVTTPFLTPLGKLSALAEPFRRRRGDSGAEETVAEFFTRRFGREVAERLVDPFVSGVWAGASERLSLPAAFPSLDRLEFEGRGVVRGMLRRRFDRRGERPSPRTPVGFREGMAQWPEALRRRLGSERVRTGVEVIGISRRSGEWAVRARSGEEFRSEALVLAIPAFALPPLLESLDRDAALALAGIPHASVAVVHHVRSRSRIRHPLDGFGMLVPSREGRRILGSLWPGSLFPDRLPEGKVLTTTFLGGARAPSMVTLDDAALLAIVEEEERTLLGAEGRAEASMVVRHSRGIPQYERGHGERMRVLERLEAKEPTLRLTGNWRGGIAVAAAAMAGREAAHALIASRPIRSAGTGSNPN